MNKRIFRAVFCVSTLAVVVSLGVVLAIVVNFFSKEQTVQLLEENKIMADGVEHFGLKFLETMGPSKFRITWIAPDGKVLFDNKAHKKMENHLHREEVEQALARGEGQSIRYSKTLMTKYIYGAKRLSDGSILRTATAYHSFVLLLKRLLLPLVLILIGAMVLSMGMASKMAAYIVKPINEMDLENPVINDGYEEMRPLLKRIEYQQRELHQKEIELLRRQTEFDVITSHMDEALLLASPKGEVIYQNKAAYRILGREYKKGVSREVFENLGFQDLFQGAVDGDSGHRTIRVEGEPYRVHVNPVHYDGKKIYGVVVLFFSISGQERAEEMRREFTANVSHELKTPLHAISGYAELLEKGMVLTEDVGTFGGRIYQEAQRMIQLIEDIIRLSHLDEGIDPKQFQKIQLDSLVREVISQLDPEAKEKQVTLAWKGEPCIVQGVEPLIHGIIYNLCDNGIKYNRPKGSVTVVTKNEVDGISLQVIDTGIGIAREDCHRIFERFYRVDKSHSKELGGTGLGLSIVKHSAAIHRATIHVESQEGVGTKISLLFPYFVENIQQA